VRTAADLAADLAPGMSAESAAAWALLALILALGLGLGLLILALALALLALLALILALGLLVLTLLVIAPGTAGELATALAGVRSPSALARPTRLLVGAVAVGAGARIRCCDAAITVGPIRHLRAGEPRCDTDDEPDSRRCGGDLSAAQRSTRRSGLRCGFRHGTECGRRLDRRLGCGRRGEFERVVRPGRRAGGLLGKW